jgi:TPR repeat protein
MFAFAMLVYEIVTDGRLPFDPRVDISAEIRAGHRPKIPDTVPKLVAGFIKHGWQSDANKRPEFYHILYSLKNSDEPLFPGGDPRRPRVVFEQTVTDYLKDTVQSFEAQRVFRTPRSVLAAHYDFNAVKRRSDGGDPHAKVRLGRMYSSGDGVERNLETALAYFRESAEMGWPIGQVEYAQCLRKGLGCDPNLREALVWFRRAADQSYAAGAEAFGRMVQEQIGGEELYRSEGIDKSVAVEYYRKCQNTSKICRYWHADMLASGNGVPQDLPTARNMFKRCGEEGLKEAKCRYAEMLIKGIGGDKNVHEGKLLYLQAGRQGCAGAWTTLGHYTYGGLDGIKKDVDLAFQYFQEAVLGDDVMGMVWFTTLIMNPDNGRKNLYGEARKILRKILGHPKAAPVHKAYAWLNLSKLLQTANGGDVDKVAAYTYAQRAATTPGTKYKDEAVMIFAQLCIELVTVPTVDIDKYGASRLLEELVERRVAGAQELLTRLSRI